MKGTQAYTPEFADKCYNCWDENVNGADWLSKWLNGKIHGLNLDPDSVVDWDIWRKGAVAWRLEGVRWAADAGLNEIMEECKLPGHAPVCFF